MNSPSKNFWDSHSLNYLNMAFGEPHSETITNPDGYAKESSTCGDSLEFFLVGIPEKLEFVSYRVDGCLNMEVCANTVSFLFSGKTVAEAQCLTADMIIDFLETLPTPEHHCAEIAEQAFKRALQDLLSKNMT